MLTGALSVAIGLGVAVLGTTYAIVTFEKRRQVWTLVQIGFFLGFGLPLAFRGVVSFF